MFWELLREDSQDDFCITLWADFRFKWCHAGRRGFRHGCAVVGLELVAGLFALLTATVGIEATATDGSQPLWRHMLAPAF